MYRSQGNFTGHGKVGYSGCEVNFHCPYGRRSIGPMPSCLYIHVLSIYTELAKRVCPRLRDSACWRSGDITQPMTNFFGQLYTFLLLRFSYERKRAQHPLKCHVCGEAFKERHHLTRHMTAHQARQSGTAKSLPFTTFQLQGGPTGFNTGNT